MNQTKRYEVRGMMEWHPVFRAGRTRIQVSFTGGHLCGGASTPASFETSDPVVQAVIERSDMFRQGRIRLGQLMGGGHSDRRPVGPVTGTVRRLAYDSPATVPAQGPSPVLATGGELADCASGAAVKMTASHEMTAPHEGCVFEYSKVDDICDFLQFKKNVPLERLYNDEDCFKEAERLGVVLVKKERES